MNPNNNSSDALKSSPAPTTTNNTSFGNNARNTHTSLPYTNNSGNFDYFKAPMDKLIQLIPSCSNIVDPRFR